MVIEIVSEQFVDKLGRPRSRDVFLLKCDVCGKEWKQRGAKSRLTNRNHTCSKKCKKLAHKPGGVIADKRKQTCLERFGVENTYVSEKCKQKIKQTLIKRYGVEHTFQSGSLFNEKAKQTKLERYGVESAMHSPEIRQRQIDSMQKNWGVDYPMQLQHVRDAMMSGSIAKYGVPFPMQNPEVVRRVFEKRAREGTLYQSKPENEFYLQLCHRFGEENVERQLIVNNRFWCIDFYVRNIDVYIQFDGVYWHGLDRPIEVIKESKKIRDRMIYRKWCVDRQQEKWFVQNDMNLIRITDQEFKTDPEACLLIIERNK